MIQHHSWSLTEIENMIPYERAIYMDLLNDWVKAENSRIEQDNAKMRRN